MNDNRTILCYLYESQIANQQIQYYILKEEYDNATNKPITEGLSDIGNWISDKVKKATHALKVIWNKIITFVTKTFQHG